MEDRRREARRRRLSETGADRLAFITGKVQSLPENDNATPPRAVLTRHTKSVGHLRVDENTEFVMPNSEMSNDAAKNSLVKGTEVRPLISSIQKSLSTSYIVEKSPLISSAVQESPAISSALQNSSSSASHNERHVQPRPAFHRIFTANRVKSSISASENIRLFCSIIIALWVVISSCSYHPDDNMKGTLASRPLYLLLLTNATIVLGQLLIGYGFNEKAEIQSRRSVNDADGWAEKAGEALELGLVLQKVFAAAFMDCSVYVVFLTSGLSLIQYWL